MKSTFFHIGINRTLAEKKGWEEPRVKSDGSIAFVPLPSHHDPDLDNVTYGDPWGRLGSFSPGDIAWFIESATVSDNDWGYYLMAYFVIEDMYLKKNGTWNKPFGVSHSKRIAKNAHEIRKDANYAIILGSREFSKLILDHPLRISTGQDAYPKIKQILALPLEISTTGYWFKKWFTHESTSGLLDILP
jgi:hypothetical protein